MSKPYEVVILGPAEEAEPADWLRGLLQTVLDHTAKQITCILDIIADEYGHSREDLAALVREDKRFSAVLEEKPTLQIPIKTKSGRKAVIVKAATTKKSAAGGLQEKE